MSFSEWIILRTGGQSWYIYFYTTCISVDLAYHEIFHAKVGKGDIKICNSLLITRTLARTYARTHAHTYVLLSYVDTELCISYVVPLFNIQ